MRRSLPLQLLLLAAAIASLTPQEAPATTLERRIAHANGLSLTIEAIEPRQVNAPLDNPELRVPAHSRLGARLVFIGPAGLATRQMMLSANEGIGTTDNPYDNSPVLKTTLPVEPPGEDGAASQAAHPNGSFLRVHRVTADPASCHLSLSAANGNDRTILLNQQNSLALTDRNGASAPVQPPPDNPELVVPPGGRLDAELVFPCGRLDTGAVLQLSSNRNTAGTTDNPYDTLPVFAVQVRAEPAAGGPILPRPHATVTPIDRSEMSPVPLVAAAETAPGKTPAAQPPRRSPASVAEKPADPVLPQARQLPAPPPAETSAQLEAALHAVRTDRGLRIVLAADELFGSSRDALDPGAEAVLAKLDALIAAIHPREIDISGHTDSSGDDDDNLKLSEQRARTVAAWLEQHSSKRHPRLVAKGYGRTRPAAPNHNPDGSDNPDGRTRNRRIEILLRR